MPHFVFIQGNLGAGKTTIASVMAHYWKNVAKIRYGVDVKLFSNYGLLGSAPMDSYESWYDVADAQGSICVWDEAQMAFDSRTSLKYSQVTATQVLMYCRKLKSVQIFVSPSIDNIDTRIRQMVEVLLNVRKIGNRGISVEYFDYQAKNYGSWGKFLHSRFIPQSKLKKIYQLKLFDTFQIVQTFPLPTTERETIKFFKTLEERHNQARKYAKGVQFDETGTELAGILDHSA